MGSLSASLYYDGDEVLQPDYQRRRLRPDHFSRVRDDDGVWGYSIRLAFGPYFETVRFDEAVILYDDAPVFCWPLDEVGMPPGGTFRCTLDLVADDDSETLNDYLENEMVPQFESLIRCRDVLALMESGARDGFLERPTDDLESATE